MSYAMEHPIAVRAAESARAAFIRRTYAHLAGAILAFVGLETLLLAIPEGRQFAHSLLFAAGGLGWLIVLVAFMAVSALANYWAHSDTSPGLQYAGLALYTVAEVIIFLPLLYYAEFRFPGEGVIPTAGIMTLAMFGGLTLTVFVTGKNFNFLYPVLSVGSMLALGFILAAVIFGFSLGLVFMFAMVALISGYILFYTSAVLHEYRTDQHVAASLALFSCIATLFWYILQIVMASRE